MKYLSFFVPLLAVLFSSAPFVNAAPFQRARISQIVNSVNVLNPEKPPRPAQINEKIAGKTAVHTGVSSRSELVFPDDTVARLGSNTFFSFLQGSRDMRMEHGVMLLQAPKGAGGAKITTGAVTAAITGTTIIWEVPPPGTPPALLYIKIIVVEGKEGVRFYFNDRPLESIILDEGEMLIVPVNAKSLLEVEPVPVNIKRLIRTSLLINGLSMDQRITPFRLSVIRPVIYEQEIKFTRSDLIPTNLVIDGIGTAVLIATDYRANADKTMELNRRIPRAIPVSATPTPTPTAAPTATPTATPTGTPSKFGRPPLIIDPDPYTIVDSTVVNTDPTITTNGVTDFGTIYRNEAADGLFTNFVFGSTTQTDSMAGLNDGRDNTAVFKFSNLLLEGSPTFVTTGGPTKVFFAALNNIDSAGIDPGTNFTLEGLTEFGLIASGNIFLDSSVNFETDDNSRTLTIAARGMESFLSLANSISGINLNVNLVATLDILMDAIITAADVRLYAGRNVSLGDTLISADVLNITAENGDITFFPFPFDPNTGTGTSIGAALLNLVAGGNIILNSENFVFLDGDIFNVTAETIDVVSDFIFSETGFPLPAVTASLTAGSGGIQAAPFNLIGFENIDSKDDVSVGDLGVQNLTARDVSANTVFPNDIERDHTFTVVSLDASGGLQFDGLPADGATAAQDGGRLTLNIDSVVFESAGSITSANFSGGNSPIFDPSPAGDGGTFIVNATNDITVNTPITATTGENLEVVFSPEVGPIEVVTPSGTGGSVELNSASGSVEINSTVEVSSDTDREIGNSISAAGGNITVTSGQTDPSQVAINITNSAQLYSLLNDISPGPGGMIKIESAGGQIITGTGNIEATRGTVEIRNNGAAGMIAINGTQIAADVVKIGALGANGVLNIQAGSNISASQVMKLYGGLSNGAVRFIGNGDVFLNDSDFAGERIDIAGKTVAIDQNVTVHNDAKETRVFTDVQNYNVPSRSPAPGVGSFTNTPTVEQAASQAPSF